MVCRQVALVSQTRVYRFIAFAWLVSLFTCLAPFLALLVIVHRSACTFTTLRHIQLIVVGGVNTFVALVFAIHVVMLAQCVKIYIEISLLRKRLSQFRFREDIRGEWKAFITTAVLLLTMVAFFLPYSVVYVVSINHISQASLQSGALIYYMNLLPYLKFLSDPIIYGMRTLEVREGCFRLLARCPCDLSCGVTGGSGATSEYQLTGSSAAQTADNQSNTKRTTYDVTSV